MPPTFVITLHAQRRYAERVSGSLSGSKGFLLSEIQKAYKLKEKTHKGQFLYVNFDSGIIFIVKPDKDKLYVVTVLSLEEWETQKKAQVRDATNVLPPAPLKPKQPSAKLLSHITMLEVANTKLREKNLFLAEKVQMLESELASFRKEERQRLYKETLKHNTNRRTSNG